MLSRRVTIKITLARKDAKRPGQSTAGTNSKRKITANPALPQNTYTVGNTSTPNSAPALATSISSPTLVPHFSFYVRRCLVLLAGVATFQSHDLAACWKDFSVV
jgi:hypothetical protein